METEAIIEPPLPTPIEQDLPTTIEHELEQDTTHLDEPAAIAGEGPSKAVLDADATGDIELQSELEQETLKVLSPSAQESRVDVVSSSNDALTRVVTREVEIEVKAGTQGTDAATTSKDLTAKELPETDQPIVPTTEVFIFNSCGNVLTNPALNPTG